MTKASSRTSISSRGGSPSEETPPVPIGTRPAPVGGGPPPIPERTTPGVGSIGRHGSFSSQSGEPSEQPMEKAPMLNNVGRRDSQGKQIGVITHFMHWFNLFITELNKFLTSPKLKSF